MHGRIYSSLLPVRLRQLAFHLLRWATLGLLMGAVVAIGLGGYRWFAGTLMPWVGWSVIAAGPIVGLLVGCLRLHGWHAAATAVDAHYGLKDRIASALAFLRKREMTPLHELQVADATDHLGRVRAREVVPFRVPRVLPFAAGALALAIVALTLPIGSKQVKAGPTAPLPHVVAAAEQLTESLKHLDELAKKEQDPELERLVNELKAKVEEMKKPGVDLREALAKMSEVQAALLNQKAQYNSGLVDAQLESLGTAMSPAEALEAAGQALQDAKFDEAAKELEKLEDPQLDRKEAKTVEEKMKQVANQMGEVGLGELSEATSELADGLKGGSKGKISKGGKALAKAVKTHSRRRKINRLLEAEAESVAECKGNCNSLAKSRKAVKSTRPSLNYGGGISGNMGEKTNMLSKRNIEEISGEMSDEGSSEMETTHSPEGRQLAARKYREAYQKALQKSEAVLDSEPIPLGHRQTIRKYFELIRPQNDDGADKAEKGVSVTPDAK
jgi:hypothetical protein